jgi:hypothetical protein
MLGGASDGVGLVPATRFLVVALFALVVGVIAGGTGSAHADVPVYVGDMSFPVIQDTAGQEEYSWKVQLYEDQELRQVDSQRVQIYYESGHPALTISAEAAHDAVGASVPTTLEATGDDVITLTVHHRAGNPDAGNAPFDYPVIAGQGWEGGLQTTIVQMPPAEPLGTEPIEENHCVVPLLKGKSLRASRKQLARSACGLGRVIRRGSSAKSAKVLRQSPPAGTMLSPGGSVSVKLG